MSRLEPMVGSFRERVWEIVRAIPAGRVLAYGDVAMLAGDRKAARAVGGALRAFAGDHDGLPWHRVINSQGTISFRGDLQRANLQRLLLIREGVAVSERGSLDLARFRADLRALPCYGALDEGADF
jgi:methylated-DNA-protein-cysteine methyltransferase-like protein